MAKSLFRSGIIVSAMTFLSRVLGLVRDMVTANLVGAGAAADAFFFANRIPNFLRRLFAEGAFAQAFVPVLSEVKEKHGDDAVRLFVARAAGTLGVVVTVVTLLAVIASPLVAMLFGPNWFLAWLNDGADAQKFTLASLMLKITFPYLWFITFVALSGAVLNTYNRFAVAAFTPVFLNIAMIACAIGLADKFAEPALALAWGVFIGGLLQFLFQLPFLFKARLLAKPQFAWHDEFVSKVRKLMLPAIFGVSVSQINLLLDTVIATFLVTGSVSWLYYSDRLIEFPLGLIGIGIATVILPTLSKLHVGENRQHFQATMDWAVRFILLLGMPALVGLMMLGPLIISTLFQHGEFGLATVEKVSLSLNAYALGLVSFMLIKVLAPGFYARQDTKTPVKIAIVALVSNMVFNLLLAPFMGYVGLALATSLSATLNAGLLAYYLRKEQAYICSRFTMMFFGKVLFAASCVGVMLFFIRFDVVQWAALALWQQGLWLTGYVVAAMLVFFAVLAGLGVRLAQIKNSQLAVN